MQSEAQWIKCQSENAWVSNWALKTATSLQFQFRVDVNEVSFWSRKNKQVENEEKKVLESQSRVRPGQLRLSPLGPLRYSGEKSAAFIQSVTGRDFFFLLKTHHACKVSQDVKLSVTVSRLFIFFFRGTRDLLEVSVPRAHRWAFQGLGHWACFPGMFRAFWPWIQLHHPLFPTN